MFARLLCTPVCCLSVVFYGSYYRRHLFNIRSLEKKKKRGTFPGLRRHFDTGRWQFQGISYENFETFCPNKCPPRRHRHERYR